MPALRRYLAFLRGLNVGGHRIAMTALRGHFESLGLDDVETYIASGNVIFTASARVKPAALERKIEAHLHATLGYAVATFLRTPEELAAVADGVPFDAAERAVPEHRVHVGFLRDAPSASFRKLLKENETRMDAFGTGAREVYWLVRGRSLDTLAKWPAIEKAVAHELTMRNLNTVTKLVARYA